MSETLLRLYNAEAGLLIEASSDDYMGMGSRRAWDNAFDLNLVFGRYASYEEVEEKVFYTLEELKKYIKTVYISEITVRFYNASQGSFSPGKRIESKEIINKAKECLADTGEISLKEIIENYLEIEIEDYAISNHNLDDLSEAEDVLRGELKRLTADYNGEVYKVSLYPVDKKGEIGDCLDSIGGIYDDVSKKDILMEEALAFFANLPKEGWEEIETKKVTKEYIK